MNHEILYRPSYSIARVMLDAGEEVVAESGAMVSMSSGIEMETSMKGGLLSGLKRSILGGESFFINTFRAASAGEVMFAPPLPGDIVHVEMTGGSLLVQSTSFSPRRLSFTVDNKWSAPGASSQEELFL